MNILFILLFILIIIIIVKGCNVIEGGRSVNENLSFIEADLNEIGKNISARTSSGNNQSLTEIISHIEKVYKNIVYSKKLNSLGKSVAIDRLRSYLLPMVTLNDTERKLKIDTIRLLS